jgi:putative phosphoribosyl transferase
MTFVDRVDAGRRLGRALERYRGPDTVVLGLPRGGVPVAFEVARILHAPLDVLVVRKLGVPGQPELAMGAIGEDGSLVLNRELVHYAGVTNAQVQAVERAERAELDRRVRRFRRDRPRIDVRGRTVVIVDDGIATGSTAGAACHVARSQGASRVVVAVPVASPDAARQLGLHADEVVCLETPRSFRAVGAWYRDFSQTADDEVLALLDRAAVPSAGPSDGDATVSARRSGRKAATC